MFESLFNLLCVTFKSSYFEKHLRATTSRYLAKEFEENFMKQSFLVDRKKRLNTICKTKPNTVHLKQTTLLYLQQQSQDPALLLLQGMNCLTLVKLACVDLV